MYIPENPRFRLKQYDKTDCLRCTPEFFALLIIYHILERLSRTLRKCDKNLQNEKSTTGNLTHEQEKLQLLLHN